MESQSISPYMKDKGIHAVVLFLVTLACNAMGRKFGVSLNAEEIASLAVVVIGFVAGHKWKSGTIAAAEVKAATSPAPATAAGAAAALNEIRT